MRPRIPTVPHSVWTKWRLLQTVGDVKALSDDESPNKIASEPTVLRALNKREATVEIQNKITAYFAAKETRMKAEEDAQLSQFSS